MSFLRKALVTVVGTALLAIALLNFTLTPVLAAACPGCFGLKELGHQVFTDDIELASELDLSTMAQQARFDIDAVFGSGQSQARIVVCTRPACDKRLRTERVLGLAYGTFAVKISSHAVNKEVLRHELVHIARARQIGGRVRENRVLEEGLAEWIAKGPRPAEACPPHMELPKTVKEWRRAADPSMYVQAHCQVSRQIEAVGLESLIAQ